MPTLKPRSEIPNQAARAQLVNHLVALGYRGQDLASIVSQGKSRERITVDLISMQRAAPKG